MDKISQFFDLFTDLFRDPSQRLYWPILLVSLLLIAIYTKRQGKNLRTEFFNDSTFTDIKLLILNKLLKLFIFPLVLFSSFSVAVFLQKFLNQCFPYFSGLELTSFSKSLLATVVAFIINDFFRFAHHVMMHRLKPLKKLHGVHHSATSLTPFTLFRAHPAEALIASFRNTISMGLIIAFLSFSFKGQVSALDILGVNLFGFLFNATFSNLRHSPVPMSFGALEYLFISPRMHQIHHSNKPEHFEKNYGVALAIWDQLLGSFYRPKSEDLANIKYGISYQKNNKTKNKNKVEDISYEDHNFSPAH